MDAADAFLRSLLGDGPPPTGPAPDGLRPRAAFQGLSAVLVRRAAEGRVDLPPALLAGITDDAAAARRRCAVLDLELRRVLSAPTEATAVPIAIKGPAVASRYRDPPLRPYVDIDLLVPEDDLRRWRPALERLGFTGPTEWEERAARLGHHHLVFHRPGPEGRIPLELHWRLFAERTAAGLDHAVLAAHAEPDAALGGALVLSAEAQLVVLGVHLAHHSPSTRKLVWLLDFVELGSEAAVAGARTLAERLDVSWALENALADTESVLGEPRWRASRRPSPGLVRARAEGASGLSEKLAVARELGPRRGARYLLGRLDPRRFMRADGTYDWRAVGAWARRKTGRSKR